MTDEDTPDYEISYVPSAGRDIKRLKSNREVLVSIKATIDGLKKNPKPNGVTKLSDGSYRVRDGEFRIVYDVDDAEKTVTINRVRDRKEVYKKNE